MVVPEFGPKMKKQRLIWVGSALAAGLLALVSLTDHRQGTSPADPGLSLEPSPTHFSRREGTPFDRVNLSRPSNARSQRGVRPAPPGKPITVNRKRTRRSPGIPLTEVLDPSERKVTAPCSRSAASLPSSGLLFPMENLLPL